MILVTKCKSISKLVTRELCVHSHRFISSRGCIFTLNIYLAMARVGGINRNEMFLTLAETEGSIAPGPSVSSFQFLGARESDRGVTAETPWPNFLRPAADLLHYQLSHLTTIIWWPLATIPVSFKRNIKYPPCVSLPYPSKWCSFWKRSSEMHNKTQSYKFCPATISLDKCLSFTPLCSSLPLYEETKQQSKRQKIHTISLEKCLSLTPPVSCATAHPIRHLWPWQTEGRLHRQGYRCKHRRKHILTHNKTDMYVVANTDVNTFWHTIKQTCM